MEEKKPKPRGGARVGAGRKPKGGAEGSHRVTFRCSARVWNILQLEDNMTYYIEEAILEKKRREERY